MTCKGNCRKPQQCAEHGRDVKLPNKSETNAMGGYLGMIHGG